MTQRYVVILMDIGEEAFVYLFDTEPEAQEFLGNTAVEWDVKQLTVVMSA